MPKADPHMTPVPIRFQDLNRRSIVKLSKRSLAFFRFCPKMQAVIRIRIVHHRPSFPVQSACRALSALGNPIRFEIEQIRAMQRELILLGVLPDGADNGKYDATTRSAVKRFQNRVNQLQGYEVLEPTGRMDALSMAFFPPCAPLEW